MTGELSCNSVILVQGGTNYISLYCNLSYLAEFHKILRFLLTDVFNKKNGGSALSKSNCMKSFTQYFVMCS